MSLADSNAPRAQTRDADFLVRDETAPGRGRDTGAFAPIRKRHHSVEVLFWTGGDHGLPPSIRRQFCGPEWHPNRRAGVRVPVSLRRPAAPFCTPTGEGGSCATAAVSWLTPA